MSVVSRFRSKSESGRLAAVLRRVNSDRRPGVFATSVLPKALYPTNFFFESNLAVTMASIISKKICMLGDFSVGKTSLIRRFVDREFSDEYLSTVGVKISRKTVECISTDPQKHMSVQMLIWDLEGNTKFKAITPMYLQGASGAVIVADISRQATIDHIPEHIQCFLSINPKGVVIVALNKADVFEEEKLEKALKLFSFKEYEKVIATYATSAKTGSLVDEIFQKLAYRIVKTQ